MSTATATLTAEQLLALPEDGWRYELVEGELHRMPPAGQEHGRVAMKFGWRLAQHVEARHLGIVFAAETGFVIRRNPDTVRAPDAAFVSAQHAERAQGQKGFFPGPPELAVEVVSPTDSFSDVEGKVFEWLTTGAVAVVVLDPSRRNAALYRSHQDIRVLGESDILDLAFVVSGFAVPVRELFE